MQRFLLYILLISCGFSYGQREKLTELGNFDRGEIQYGFYLGLNYKGYELKGTNASISGGPGFHLGVLANLPLNRHISIITEPGLLSSSNDLTFGEEEPIEVSTTYFHLPISIKLTTDRINNTSAFILAGLSYNYNFTAEKNIGENGDKPNDFLLTKHNLMGEIGIGASFYFPYFKFSPSIRGLYGFNNEFEGLGTTAKNSLNSLKTRAILLTLIFQ